MPRNRSLAAIIIGRNEGQRLIRCLASVTETASQVIYVDSGSTDGSVQAAGLAGAEVVDLDLSLPFTAARARNAGLERLAQMGPTEFVQFIDGDCELREGWVEHALDFLAANINAAVACGRLRERFPAASIYNRLCDLEWDTPVGETKACGGIAMMRMEAVEQVGGFNPALIAGEEPELCLRMRAKGWQIWRLDHEMTWHDAAMTRFSQWWARSTRAGYAFAEGAAMHGAPPERHWVQETRRAVVWGLALPLAILVAAAVFGPWALVGLLIYPLQVLRLARRRRGEQFNLRIAAFTVLGKFAEAQGVLDYWLRRLTGRRRGLIEYK